MPNTSSTWLGAPPVSADGFAFADGEFFAEASGQNRHCRAAHAELQAHFASGSDKDHPAHWFEAQLLHYGLKPSKTKAVARMRLLDAFNAGNLHVPSQINKLEGELKKEWTKKNREAKKAIRGGPQAETSKATPKPKATAAGSKRKGRDEGDPTTKAPAPNISVQPPAKKSRTPASRSSVSKVKFEPTVAAASPAKKQTARRGAISKGSSVRATKDASPPVQAPRTKQTARRSGAFMARGRIPPPGDPSPAPAYRTKQTARRSGAFMARGRMPPSSAQVQWDSGDEYDSAATPDSEHEQDHDREASLPPLGLLNGDYDIHCPLVTSEWPRFGSHFRMTLTLDGSSLWGSFDLGVINGVLFIDERPWQSSDDCFDFTWRGNETDGPIVYGDSNRGWIKFLGGGRIDGGFDWYGGFTFQGERVPGQGTRSGRDARSLRDQWGRYTEGEYDRLNRARWR